jgi:hypothetical protein
MRNAAQGPSTPQIIASAMIFSGRDDRVGRLRIFRFSAITARPHQATCRLQAIELAYLLVKIPRSRRIVERTTEMRRPRCSPDQ